MMSEWRVKEIVEDIHTKAQEYIGEELPPIEWVDNYGNCGYNFLKNVLVMGMDFLKYVPNTDYGCKSVDTLWLKEICGLKATSSTRIKLIVLHEIGHWFMKSGEEFSPELECNVKTAEDYRSLPWEHKADMFAAHLLPILEEV